MRGGWRGGREQGEGEEGEDGEEGGEDGGGRGWGGVKSYRDVKIVIKRKGPQNCS